MKDEYREVIVGGDEEAESPETLKFKKKAARVVKKLDVFIAPVMFLLMLISYLDRGNIGFAATQGMSTYLEYSSSLRHYQTAWCQSQTTMAYILTWN